ncbi:MAG: transposase [Thermodesulfovibrionales bacterium]|jgi:hypothetical protein
MSQTTHFQKIPTHLTQKEFEKFVFPHLCNGSRGAAPKLLAFQYFNYILKLLNMGCQWKALPIEKTAEGHPEIHYSNVYRMFRRWERQGCFTEAFLASVLELHQQNLLDTSIIHGDGSTTAAKKGGDNIGFNGHKKIKGDKVVAF